MGKMGYGYGSECHLLRWMGRHRRRLDELILDELKLTGWNIDWLDFHFDRKAKWPDAELTGLEFLDDQDVKAAWDARWPTPLRPKNRPFKGFHNWDAVAWISDDQNRELLLVEAKAEAKEVSQGCKSGNQDNKRRIAAELERAKQRLQVRDSRGDWMEAYYQCANRLAVLTFLDEVGIPAHLLFLYFCGDRRDAGRNSPQSAEEWEPILAGQSQHIGTIGNEALAARVHSLFLPVAE